jgi:hypothetical protein
MNKRRNVMSGGNRPVLGHRWISGSHAGIAEYEFTDASQGTIRQLFVQPFSVGHWTFGVD